MIDADSDTWRTVAGFLATREAQLLKSLASAAMQFDATQYTRGQLALLRDVRALATPNQPFMIETSEDYFA